MPNDKADYLAANEKAFAKAMKEVNSGRKSDVPSDLPQQKEPTIKKGGSK